MRNGLDCLSPGVQQVTAPTSAPRCLGSAAMSRIASAAARNSIAQTVRLFWNAISAAGAGRVKMRPPLNAHLACRAPEDIGASIDRIGQNLMHDIVGRQSPNDA